MSDEQKPNSDWFSGDAPIASEEIDSSTFALRMERLDKDLAERLRNICILASGLSSTGKRITAEEVADDAECLLAELERRNAAHFNE